MQGANTCLLTRSRRLWHGFSMLGETKTQVSLTRAASKAVRAPKSNPSKIQDGFLYATQTNSVNPHVTLPRKTKVKILSFTADGFVYRTANDTIRTEARKR